MNKISALAIASLIGIYSAPAFAATPDKASAAPAVKTERAPIALKKNKKASLKVAPKLSTAKIKRTK